MSWPVPQLQLELLKVSTEITVICVASLSVKKQQNRVIKNNRVNRIL